MAPLPENDSGSRSMGEAGELLTIDCFAKALTCSTPTRRNCTRGTVWGVHAPEARLWARLFDGCRLGKIRARAGVALCRLAQSWQAWQACTTHVTPPLNDRPLPLFKSFTQSACSTGAFSCSQPVPDSRPRSSASSIH